MPETMSLNVRVSGSLSEFVSSNVSDVGSYDNVSEYIRDLIRQDKKRVEQRQFERLKAELQLAFAAPEADYLPLSAEEIFQRNDPLRKP